MMISLALVPFEDLDIATKVDSASIHRRATV
jgi:hypothetical protein